MTIFNTFLGYCSDDASAASIRLTPKSTLRTSASSRRRRRERATGLAHRLPVIRHRWVSLGQVGFPLGTDDVPRASFEAGVRALLPSA
ncbi:MAG: hypothetical protein KIT73_05275 [Burkholderiales bacterium]|nr:hypothetical protein [Burkholderiales bacterium]